MKQKILRTCESNTISYKIGGSGDTILFIHAGGLNQEMWLQQIDFFECKYKLITYDIRGCGKSISNNERPFDFQDIEAMLEEENINSIHIVGLSLGAIIALDFTLNNPANVNKLVLASPGLIGYQEKQPDFSTLTSNIINAIQSGKKNEIINQLKKLNSIGQRKNIPDAKVAGYVEQQLENYIANGGLYRAPIIKFQNPLSKIDSLNKNILIIYGKLDLEYVKKNAEKLHTKIQNATLTSIDDTAHLINMEKSSIFNEIISDFLDDSREVTKNI